MALVMCMILICVMSVLTAGMAEMSVLNMRMAGNHRLTNRSLESAQSGLQIVGYWLDGITVGGTVAASERLATVHTALQSRLNSNGVTNIDASYDAAANSITISNFGSSIILDSTTGQNFSAIITQTDDDTLQIDVTGNCGQFSRAIRINSLFTGTGSAAFDYGIATKGPLAMTGQADISGATLPVEASVYIEGIDEFYGDSLALSGQASIAGDISIADEGAVFSLGNQTSVGGETGESGASHVSVGAVAVDFPIPDVEYFRVFATGDVIDGATNLSSYSVLENAIILSGTDPVFSNNMTIKGVLFIEENNNVQFSGQSTVKGIIVGDGDYTNMYSTDSVKFTGQVTCEDVSTLVGEQFDAIKNETGTFIVAPGFDLEFSGQANTISGAVASNGISFTGQAGGTINGSVINYSTDAMTMTGQGHLIFDRSDTDDDPTGFISDRTLSIVASSYSEPAI